MTVLLIFFSFSGGNVVSITEPKFQNYGDVKPQSVDDIDPAWQDVSP